ncbi:MAG: hypothetical protein KA733_11105 [Thauera sp.]|nr:hypothetical protein [Thauera sp.]
MQANSEAVLVATGALPALILIAAALTLPVCLALLALYRRAVLRSMALASPAAGSASSHPQETPSTPATPPTAALRLEPREEGAAGARPAQARMRRSLRAAGLVQLLAGLAYALVLTTAWMQFAWQDGGFVLTRFLLVFACHAWPAVLAVGLVTAGTTRQRLSLGLAYVLPMLVLAAWALSRNPALSALDLAGLWASTNLPPTLLLLAFLHRRIRAVGPLVLAFMLVAVIGAEAAVRLAGQSEATMRMAVGAGGALGLDGTQTFWALLLVGAAVATLLGRLVLKWLGRRHVARRSSDQLLTLEAMWLLFAVVQSVGFAFEGLAWLAAGPLAFLAWKLTTLAGFRLARLGLAQGPAPGLLLLRVFALGARSERLFDAFGKRWLRIGHIDMIAGPDLATTAVEPHEFLDFVGGRLSRAFVRDEADLARRHAARALGPDPDGRHRVNEFFCHDDTWRPTMLCLARAADAVLMDLRGFSPQNEGCRYELQQLLDHVALERVVVLVGRDTERGFLDSTLAALWQSSRADSPNRDKPGPLLRMVEERGDDTAERLVEALLEAPPRKAAVP